MSSSDGFSLKVMNTPANGAPRTLTVAGRIALIAFTIAAIVLIWVSNHFLTERYTATTRARAEVRQALYAGNMMSELQRSSVVPILLARDPVLTGALNGSDFSQTSRHLISYVEEIGAAGILLLDDGGTVVAATDRALLDRDDRQAGYFTDALRTGDTVFRVDPSDSGGFNFTYSRRIDVNDNLAGVIVVIVDLAKFERSWAGISDAVVVTNSDDQVLLTTEPSWRGRPLEEALQIRDAPTAIERALRVTTDWRGGEIEGSTYLAGKAVMRTESRIPFRDWRMTSFTTYASVRERVNSVLALEIMGIAILLAMTFYMTSRRAVSKAGLLQQESAQLRDLNAALQREMAERKKAEKHLEVAEQSLAQSSKLAVLGEMSAAVSHELNQPLAAMKTYLAGAKLLIQRRRTQEAAASFGRIDDLIDRMNVITKQLKSYARKGTGELIEIDLRASVDSALSMMEPQLKQGDVVIERTMPPDPVMVDADQVRLEQVLVNLLRNAFDAAKDAAEPKIEILVSGDPEAVVTVRDNGDGIVDMEQLFDPFYTTKAPGDGVGLGLAISSGIITEMGGQLTARNRPAGGASFEVVLPLSDHNSATE